MKIEILVYAYLAVCLAMIGFNIVCIFLFSRNDRETEQSRLYYINLIKEQFGKAVIDERHRMLILKRLVHVREMTAFDKSLEILSKEYPAEVQAYLRGLKSVFVALANRYSRRNEIQMAYFPYIIARYKLFYGEDLPQINRIMVDLLEEQFTIEWLSREYSTNRTTLMADFKRVTGKTINEFVLDKRIDLSKQILAFTNISIEELALKCGFSSQSYFTRAFKKKTGLSPMQFRKQAVEKRISEFQQ